MNQIKKIRRRQDRTAAEEARRVSDRLIAIEIALQEDDLTEAERDYLIALRDGLRSPMLERPQMKKRTLRSALLLAAGVLGCVLLWFLIYRFFLP